MAREVQHNRAAKCLQTTLTFKKVETPTSEPQQPVLQSHSIVRHLLDRQLAPHGSACGRAAAAAQASGAYTLVHSFRQPGAVPGAITQTWPGRCVQACFSRSGNLLAVLCEGLGVRIIDYRAIQSRPWDGNSIFADAYWAYPNSVFSARCIAWNLQQEAELYLLVHKGILRCSPERCLSWEEGREQVDKFIQADAEHITFFRGNPQLFAVSSLKGEVKVWDPRASSARWQTSLVAPQNMTRLTQVQASSDGHVITAGARTGHIIMWDIRMGRSGVHQLGAYGPAKQPVLAVISMRKALAAIPGLSTETHIPGSHLYQLLLDPLDDTRAGYTLGCGWQGCIDLQRQEITHAYCPPMRAAVERFKRPAMWQPGSPFVSLQLEQSDPIDIEIGDPGLEFLDFSSGSASPCMVRGVLRQRSVLTSAVCLKLGEVGTSWTAAMHPTTHEIAVPSYVHDELHVVSQSPSPL